MEKKESPAVLLGRELPPDKEDLTDTDTLAHTSDEDSCRRGVAFLCWGCSVSFFSLFFLGMRDRP